MKKFVPASKSSLFLMELISSVLILSLCTTVCIRIFAASWEARKQAREWNHIQECITNAAEILEATSGTEEEFLSFLPDGRIDNSSVLYYYDSAWNPVEAENAVYEMRIVPKITDIGKEIQITFSGYLSQEDTVLYETSIRYPVLPSLLEGGIR